MTETKKEIKALCEANQFLIDLQDPKKTPRISKAIRDRAARVYAHYPLRGVIDVYWKTHERYTWVPPGKKCTGPGPWLTTIEVDMDSSMRLRGKRKKK